MKSLTLFGIPAIYIFIPIALILPRVPVIGKFFNIINTAIHEFGHALMALIMQGKVHKIELMRDTSGTTVTQCPTLAGNILVSLAGYPFAAFAGWFFCYLNDVGYQTGLIIGLSILMIIMLIFWIRNWYGLIWIVLFCSLNGWLIYANNQQYINIAALFYAVEGFLNGHTPFSAMLSFYSLLVSYGTNTREVALSNESSANEPTIPGTKINHQYSKTLEYEEDFRYYVKTFLNDSNHYYSYLRPYTELQIAEMFAQHPQYFPVFKSCNAGSKENKWCCNCSKCLFAYIILSPFIDNDTMVSIFGEDLLDKPEMEQYFDELRGVAPNKPFECVGTIDEVNKALEMIRESRRDKKPFLPWSAMTSAMPSIPPKILTKI